MNKTDVGNYLNVAVSRLNDAIEKAYEEGLAVEMDMLDESNCSVTVTVGESEYLPSKHDSLAEKVLEAVKVLNERIAFAKESRFTVAVESLLLHNMKREDPKPMLNLDVQPYKWVKLWKS